MSNFIWEDFDFMHDDRLARRLKRKCVRNKEFKVNSFHNQMLEGIQSLKSALDGGMVDKDYACFLNLALKDIELRNPIVEDDNKSVEDDPDYMMFLKNLKEHGKSYVLQLAVENEASSYVKYEAEDSSDDELESYRMIPEPVNHVSSKNDEFSDDKPSPKDTDSLKVGREHETEVEMIDESNQIYVNGIKRIADSTEPAAEDAELVEHGKRDDKRICELEVLVALELRNPIVEDDNMSVEDDPDYVMFLENLKEDGKSYVLQLAVENEASLYVKYEAEDSSDDELESYRMIPEPVNHVSSKNDEFSDDNPSPKDTDSLEVGLGHETEVEMIDESYQIYLNGITEPAVEDAELVEYGKGDDRSICESEVLVALNASDFGEGSYSPFETSKLCITWVDEDVDGLPCFGNPNASIHSWYREKLTEKLSESYNDKEYDKLWLDITEQRAKERTFHFRSGVVKTCKKDSEPGGPSYLDQYPDLEKKLYEVRLDKCKELNLLRGFFFWLQNLVRNDAFPPWLDSKCLEVMPRNPM